MPNGFDIGPITIHFYGIILMLGALAAAWLASREARRRNEDPNLVWDMLLWVLIGGIIGARLWHIFTPPPSMVEQGITTKFYLTHPLDMIAIWNGGLGIPGAVIGGALAMYIYCRRKKLNFGTWADIAAPGLALAQAIGRWGNFVNQELYGRPTTLPWGIKIDYAPGYSAETRFHPLFLYESLYNLANMFFLLWLARRHKDKLLPGDIFIVYTIVYAIGRFFLDFLRLDNAQAWGINVNQVFMLLIAVGAGALLFFRHRKKRPALWRRNKV
jgi:phosphatidylglycerol:prolipoprotein diacylglycerol transferase